MKVFAMMGKGICDECGNEIRDGAKYVIATRKSDKKQLVLHFECAHENGGDFWEAYGYIMGMSKTPDIKLARKAFDEIRKMQKELIPRKDIE